MFLWVYFKCVCVCLKESKRSCVCVRESVCEREGENMCVCEGESICVNVGV